MTLTSPIAITAGEPAGVGPTLVGKIAHLNWPAPLVIVTNRELLSARVKQFDVTIQIKDYCPNEIPAQRAGMLYCLDVPLHAPVIPAKPDVANAQHVLNCLTRTVQGCLAGEFAAMVTGPVDKSVINQSGTAFRGQTEFIANLAKVNDTVMLLAAPGLKVALATTHLPLAAVPKAITKVGLRTTLNIIEQDLARWFGISKPTIFVCGLNPHAGEGGYLGREEIEVIAPVIAKLRQEGKDVRGPFSADTVFRPSNLTQADVICAMYHDQGLPVLKYHGFGTAVNITLGLPLIRTSVDHGVAYDICDSSEISSTSMQAAIQMAIDLASKQRG